MLSTMQDVPLLLSRILEYGATAHGSAEVVTWTAEANDGGEPRRATFAQVGRRCAQLAHALRDELGIDGDQRVATFMWNNQEHLEAYLAIPSMGAVLHALNIRLFPEQLVYVANHAEDRVVIVDNTLAGPFAKLLPHFQTVETVVVNGPIDDEVRGALAATGKRLYDYEELLAGRPETFEWPVLDERSAAAMCYTSGTTGNPKGVVYSHRSDYLHTMQLCMASTLAMKAGDRVLAIVPLFHANAWGLPYAAFMGGASLLMPDRFLQAEPLCRFIEREKASSAAAVPTIWTDVLNYLDSHDVDITTLNDVIVGGSACPPALMRAFQERYGVRILHAWGMTETSPLGSVALPPPGLDEAEHWRYRETQGRLSVAVEGRLVGPAGDVMPWDGESVGELEVRGPWITGSYYREDDPLKFDEGWLRTGDVGRITPDGFLTLTDRAKDVIKSGGEWISSVDLENALMAHPAVLEASVVGVPDERWGERPLATVVVREGQSVSAEQLREFLADKVARWQLPERWAFIDAVPKTSVGKFDKKVIRQRYAEGALAVEQVASAPSAPAVG
ncbi:MAG: long-chain fatty acid--CoA ligase [Actinomycetes bacterium]